MKNSQNTNRQLKLNSEMNPSNLFAEVLDREASTISGGLFPLLRTQAVLTITEDEPDPN